MLGNIGPHPMPARIISEYSIGPPVPGMSKAHNDKMVTEIPIPISFMSPSFSDMRPDMNLPDAIPM